MSVLLFKFWDTCGQAAPTSWLIFASAILVKMQHLLAALVGLCLLKTENTFHFQPFQPDTTIWNIIISLLKLTTTKHNSFVQFLRGAGFLVKYKHEADSLGLNRRRNFRQAISRRSTCSTRSLAASSWPLWTRLDRVASPCNRMDDISTCNHRQTLIFYVLYIVSEALFCALFLSSITEKCTPLVIYSLLVGFLKV